MQTQNTHIFKPNNSDHPSKISIFQLPHLASLPPLSLEIQAFEPLNLDFFKLKNQFFKFQSNKIQPFSANSAQNNQKHKWPLSYEQYISLIQQNQFLIKEADKSKDILQQQKLKYNELKNLYKEGEAMFEMLRQKNILLEKDNKELVFTLQNLHKQIESQNKVNTLTNTPQKLKPQKKIQRVRVGNKHIPVIKVNVPPETFVKKDHKTSVFCSAFEQSSAEQNSEQLYYLRKKNKELFQQNNMLKQQLQQLREYLGNSQGKNRLDEFEGSQYIYEGSKQRVPKKQYQSTQKRTNYHENDSFQFQSTTNYNKSSQKPTINLFECKDLENSESYYRQKIEILETEIKKKDEILKDLYNQCYIQQNQNNRLKSQSNRKSQAKSNASGFSCEQRGQRMYGSKAEFSVQKKVSQLQFKVNEINDKWTLNLNNSLKIKQMQELIDRITRENQAYSQKLMNQQMETQRLYKILEGKNNELSQIYSFLAHSKSH